MTRQGSRRANSVRLAGTGPVPPRPLFVDHELKADEGRVGPHDHLTRAEVLALLPTCPSWPSRDSKADRDRGHMRLLNAVKILDWLAAHPGGGWQERWRAAGKEFVLAAVLGDDQSEGQRNGLVAGLNCLMMSRIVLPGYAFLRGYKAWRLFKDVQQMFPDGDLETMRNHGVGLGMTPRHVDEGLRLISAMILHTGRDLHELTAEDIFHVRALGRRLRGEAFIGTHTAWELLRGVGVIESKETLKDALRFGQRPTAELVDVYNIQSTAIRNVAGAVSRRAPSRCRLRQFPRTGKGTGRCLLGGHRGPPPRHRHSPAPRRGRRRLEAAARDLRAQQERGGQGATWPHRRDDARPRLLPRHPGMGARGPVLGAVGRPQPHHPE